MNESTNKIVLDLLLIFLSSKQTVSQLSHLKSSNHLTTWNGTFSLSEVTNKSNNQALVRVIELNRKHSKPPPYGARYLWLTIQRIMLSKVYMCIYGVGSIFQAKNL